MQERGNTIVNCYVKATLTATGKYDGGGTGIMTADFADSTKFTNWDFENTWVIKDGYPELRIFVK